MANWFRKSFGDFAGATRAIQEVLNEARRRAGSTRGTGVGNRGRKNRVSIRWTVEARGEFEKPKQILTDDSFL